MELPSPGLGDGFVHKEEDGFLGRELDAFPYDPHELGHRDVRGHQILPLIDVHYLRSADLLDNHLETTNQQKCQSVWCSPSTIGVSYL